MVLRKECNGMGSGILALVDIKHIVRALLLKEQAVFA
jgi:hypothetical protein